MHFFSKTKCTPIFSDFVAHYNTLNNSACRQLVSLKIRVCDYSYSKLYNNVRFAVHALYNYDASH